MKYKIVGKIRNAPNEVIQITPMRNAMECTIVERPAPSPGDQVLGEFAAEFLPSSQASLQHVLKFVSYLGLINNAERVTVEDESGYLLVDIDRHALMTLGAFE